MMDLMYFGSAYEPKSSDFEKEFIIEIKSVFQNVTLKDAYDDIKGYRQEVHIDEAEKDNYFAFLIGKGWYQMSLTMGIALRSESEKENSDRWISIAKEKYPEAFKADVAVPKVAPNYTLVATVALSHPKQRILCNKKESH